MAVPTRSQRRRPSAIPKSRDAVRLAATVAMLFLPAAGADARAERPVGLLRIVDGWTPATPAGATVAAGYLTIRNTGDGDRLLGGMTTTGEAILIHEMRVDGGVMRMRPVTSGAPVPPRGMLRLAPQGLHLMIPHPERARLEAHIPITLLFARAGALQVDLAVLAPGRTPSSPQHLSRRPADARPGPR